jgi:hypothetical protein
VSLALGHELDATLHQGSDDLVELPMADVTVPLPWREVDDAADLDAVDGSRGYARGLCKLGDHEIRQSPGPP